MARPVIWVTPQGEQGALRRELARNNHKLTDMDRLAIAEFICLLARQLVSQDDTTTAEHDVVFQGIPLPGLTQIDMIEMGMQAFSSLRYR